jgi:hypothetical protein
MTTFPDRSIDAGKVHNCTYRSGSERFVIWLEAGCPGSARRAARVGYREPGDRKDATHHQHDKLRPPQEALPSLDRRFDNLFASPLHIFLRLQHLFGYDRRITTGCTRWWNDWCPSSAHRGSCYSGVNAGWGADDAFRLRKLIAESGASGRLAHGWPSSALTLRCLQGRPGGRRQDLRLREIQRRGGDHGAHCSYQAQHAHGSALYS